MLVSPLIDKDRLPVLRQRIADELLRGSVNPDLYAVFAQSKDKTISDVAKQINFNNNKSIIKAAKILSYLPFIKSIAVVNSLAFFNCDKKSDIDFLIITERNKIWTARALSSVLMHILGLRRYGKKVAKRICLSFYISEEKLDLSYIAKNISSNIRELEGALNRLVTHCQFNGQIASTETAEQILKDQISSNNRSVDTAEIFGAVSKHYGISTSELVGHSRQRELILPRQIAIYLIREQTNKSLPEIGKIMGGKDHTTVLHSQRKIASEIKVNTKTKSDVEQIRQTLFEVKRS